MGSENVLRGSKIWRPQPSKTGHAARYVHRDLTKAGILRVFEHILGHPDLTKARILRVFEYTLGHPDLTKARILRVFEHTLGHPDESVK